MSDQWPSNAGGQPPVPPSTPPEWGQAGIPPLSGPPAYGQPPTFATPPPAGPPPGPSDPNRALKLVAVALAFLLLVAVGALVIVSRANDDKVAATGPTTTTTTQRPGTSTTRPPTSTRPGTTTAPSTTTTLPTGPAATQADLDAAVADISKFVEQARGLKFKEPVKARLASEDEFNQDLLKDFDKEKDSMQRQERVLKALGLIPADLDLVASMRKLLGAGVLGYYDPETKELVVRGVALTPYVRQTLAHELTHALDDQNFNLNRPEYDDRKDEISFGFHALAEGNARAVEDKFVDTMTADERKQRAKEEIDFAKNADISGIPVVLLKLLDAPYSKGQVLVNHLIQTGGQPAIDKSFPDPPQTSRQVLHPTDYDQRTPRAEVPKPTADGKVVDEGVFGELMIDTTLEDELDKRTADAAGDGWLGDWYVAWDDNGGTCVRIDIKMESPAERDELYTAFDQWAKAKPKAGVEKQGTDSVLVTSCTTASGGGENPL